MKHERTGGTTTAEQSPLRWSFLRWSFLRRTRLRWGRSFVAAVSCAASFGCRSTPEVDEVTVREPTTGRAYRILERRGGQSFGGQDEPARARPVLLVLHPYAYPAEQLVNAHRLRERAVQERDWLVVVPEGERDSEGNQFWNASAACCGAEPGGPDDVSFLHAVLDDVGRRRRVDTTRVFLLGVSNGGFLAHRFGCDASERVRAIVSVAAAGPGPEDPPCRPARPVSLLHVHGVLDETIRFSGGSARGARYPGVQDSVAPWLRFPGGTTIRRRGALRWFGSPFELETHHFPTHRVEVWTVPEGDHALSALRHAVPRLLEFLEAAPSG